jgi:Mg2+/Co2+ transporter CorC
MLALSVNTLPAAAADAIISSGHSRVPVYEDGIDNIVGLVYAMTPARAAPGRRAQRPLRDLLRRRTSCPRPEIDDLLRELQVKRQQVVVDEYGGVAGLITVEDIRELVGELQDEYDVGEGPCRQTGPDEYVSPGAPAGRRPGARRTTDPESGDTPAGSFTPFG